MEKRQDLISFRALEISHKEERRGQQKKLTPRTDSSPTDQIGRVLRTDRIQELAPGRQAHRRNLQQQTPRQPQALVDLETAVQLRVVDEPLPADGRAGFLKVDAHEDVEVVRGFVGVGFEKAGVFEGSFDIVH